MARQLIKGELRDGDNAVVDLKDGKIVIIPTVAAEVGA
jgi:ATP-dependent Clp protease ATP-binding subunit ClpB